MEHKQFVLPISVITQHDLTQLISEVEAIDDFFVQSKVRRAGTPMEPPKSSAIMGDVLEYNKLNLVQQADRDKLKLALQAIRSKAPTIHISFSSNASRAFLERVTGFIRREIHPQIILQVGLQPNIGAGFTLRTTNKFFDFSLRQRFVDSKPKLMQEVRDKVAEYKAKTSQTQPQVEAQQKVEVVKA